MSRSDEKNDTIIEEVGNWLQRQATIDKKIMEVLDDLEKGEGESSRRRQRYYKRDRYEGHVWLLNDYFSDNPVYPPEIFRRRFRMRRELFTQIVQSLENHSEYFQWREDACGVKGLSPIQKVTAAIRQLAYGSPADLCYEYIRIGEYTAQNCLTNFCRCIIEVYGSYYLRRPTENDVMRLLNMHQQRHGFPGMLGSIYCMHWAWKNFPVRWKGQFTRGDKGCPTVILEAVASYDLWIWHAYFGIAGSDNDINVLNQSPLFNDVLNGYAPNVQFTVNGTQYNKGYYLADGIYPEWATFVKSFSTTMDPKRCKYKQIHEAARKDMKRAFGVLQARWAIVRGPARFWSREKMKDIMYACIILHNMIVEDERVSIMNWSTEDGGSGNPLDEVTRGAHQDFQFYLRRHAELRDREVHHQLRADLVEHIWQQFGENNENN